MQVVTVRVFGKDNLGLINGIISVSPWRRDAKLVALKSVSFAKESKMRNLLTLKKLCMTSIMNNFNASATLETIENSDDTFVAKLSAALCQEFLDFVTSQDYFHNYCPDLVHLAILLVNSNTISLDVCELLKSSLVIDFDVEKKVVKKLMDSAWRLQKLVINMLPEVLLQPFQPIATLRHLEIRRTELNDRHIGIIVRNTPNLVTLKVCLDLNQTTVETLVHLRWLRCLEEFVLLRNFDDNYFHFMRRILHFLPHLKVAGSKADHKHAIQYHDVLTHCVPVGHMELPLEHLFVGHENLSLSQAKMLPKLKALCVDLGDFDVQPVPNSLLKFPELESLALNKLPSTSSSKALKIVLQAYKNRLKKLNINSSLVPIDLMQTLTCCPLLEELRVEAGALEKPQCCLLNLGLMNSLVSVKITVRSKDELTLHLFPRIMASPQLHDIALTCNSINENDRRLVQNMAEAGDFKKLEYFRLHVNKLLSDREKLEYELLTYSVFAFSPSFKFRRSCCTLHMFQKN